MLMKKKIFKEFERELMEIRLRDLWEDEELIGTLTKINALLSDVLNMLNPKCKPMFLGERTKK